MSEGSTGTAGVVAPAAANAAMTQPIPASQPAPKAERASMRDFGKLATGQIQPGRSHEQNVIDKPISDSFSDPANVLGRHPEAKSIVMAEPEAPSLEGDVMGSEDADAEQRARYEEWAKFMEADDLGEPLMEKFITATVNGRKERMTVKDAVSGVMMGRDYTNKLKEVHNYARQVEAKDRGYDTLMANMKGGGAKFIEMMEYFGDDVFKSFREAALMYGNQLYAEQNMSPQQAAVYKQARANEHRAKIAEMRARQLEQQLAQQQQPDSSAEEQRVINQIAQLMTIAEGKLKRQGIEWANSAFTRRVFEEHWAVRIQGMDVSQIDSDFVTSCMRSAHEEIQHELAQSRQGKQPTLAERENPPLNQGFTGAVQPGPSANGKKQREKISNLGRMVVR